MKTLRTVLTGLIALPLLAGVLSAQSIDVTVEAGLNAAIDFANANPGSADTLKLVTDGGDYPLTPVHIEQPMVIMAAPGLATAPTIYADPTTDENDFITIDADLTVMGLTIDGQGPDGVYGKFKYMFKVNNPPADDGSFTTPSLYVYDSDLRNVYAIGTPEGATDGNFFDISRTAYAENVHFHRTTFTGSGDEGVRSINAHKEPVHPNGTAIGSLQIIDCTFDNINGSAIKIESDGDPESYDGEVTIDHVTFNNCQRRVFWERDYVGSTFTNIIIANSKTGNDTFGGTDALVSHQREAVSYTHLTLPTSG